MVIKKFKVIAPRDWVAWWLPLAVMTVLCGAGFVYGQDPPPGFKTACIMAPTIFWTAFVLRTRLRLRFRNSIVGYTSHGIGVRQGDAIASMRSRDLLAIVDGAAHEALAFWSMLGPRALISTSLNGVILTFSEKIIYVWQGPKREVEGIQHGSHVVVKWAPGDTDEQVQSRIRHELSHVILDHVGIDPSPAGEGHHKYFRKVGFPDVG